MAEEHLKNHPNHSLFVLGELGRHYFEQRGIEIEKQFHYTVQNPTLNRARNIAEEILELYLHKRAGRSLYYLYQHDKCDSGGNTDVTASATEKGRLHCADSYRHTEGGAGTQAIA